ncbi:MAG: hypothetical protein ACLQU1_32575 [Bryobacteraceae bacterium]
MSQALRIFRKDIVHLWPRAAGFAVLLAVLCRQDAALPEGSAAWHTEPLLEAPFLLACLYLTASVIHAERPAGDCPYWVTRPFSWRSLLAAKALTLLVFLNLPVFLAQSISLAVNGLSPFDHFPILIWRQVFFTALVVLPAAALAAVTESLAGFALGALLYFGLPRMAIFLAGDGARGWPGWEWIRISTMAVLSLAAAAVVLGLQFARRRTGTSRIILGTVAIAMGLCQVLTWHIGFAIQTALSGTAPDKTVRIVFAPAHGPAPPGTHTRRGEAAGARVVIPVEVSGLSADQGLRVEGVRTTIEALNGRHWDSGWGFAGEPVLSAEGESPRSVLTSDGPNWLEIAVAPEFYEAVKDGPVHLRSTLALTLLGDSTSTDLELGGARIAGDTGVCWTHPAGGVVAVACSSPFWRAARSTLRVRSQSTGESVACDLLSAKAGALAYGPYPTDSGLSMWSNRVEGRVYTPPFPIEIILDTHPPAGFAERTVDVPAIRLSAYQTPPVGK